MLTNMTELFDSELREAQRLGFGNRKRGIAGVRQCRQHRFFAEQSGKPIRIESGTPVDRIARIEESAKHRESDSLSRLLRCTCQVYLPLRVLTPPPSFVI